MLKAGRLADALRELAVRSGVDLLFSPDLVGNRRSPPIAGRMSVDEALERLLQGSGLAFRREGAAIVIYQAPAESQPVAVPEILVVGRKTQNADIRRSQNDIQPYQVFTAADIEASGADDLDEYFRERAPNDAETGSPSQLPNQQSGSNRSEIDLHGLGANQTLVLIDGARMPSVPAEIGDLALMQPDLNGLSPAEIERVEVRTGTAGGIYGPDAIGGVINVVLKRDYRGADLGVTTGATDRGDAGQLRLDGRVGFTPDDGRTDVMIAASYAFTDPLQAGDRDFAQQARAREIAQNPSAFVAGFPVIDGVLVWSIFGQPLTLSPALGGATLRASYTYLPTGLPAGSNLTALLAANAGHIPSALPPDGNGATQSLTTGADVTSLIVNVRHRFTDRVEGFVDLIGFEDDGRAVIGARSAGSVVETGDPIQQAVAVTFPLVGFDSFQQARLDTLRFSSGLIIRLPADWTAELSESLGFVRTDVTEDGFMLNNDFALALAGNQPGAGGEPAPNPFGGWTQFVAALQAYKIGDDERFTQGDDFQDTTLRLAGPLFVWRPGPVSLSVLAEYRQDAVPVGLDSATIGGATRTVSDSSFSQAVESISGEVRAPLVARDSGPWPLHGLELQLAVRYDDNQALVPTTLDFSSTSAKSVARQGAAAYTGGLRAFPSDRLMLRASLSSGELPPTPTQLLPERLGPIQFPPGFVFPGWGDPERGGRTIGTEAPVTLSFGGSPTLQPEWAQTLSLGAVLNPDAEHGPRISLDYTHIDKRNEISTAYQGNVAYFLANPGLYPGHVVREPLSAADAAAGFTGGIVTQVLATSLNIGRSAVDAVDLPFDETFHLSASDSLTLYDRTTWEPRLSRQAGPGLAVTDYVGFDDGPLRWRGNAGAAWTHSPFMLDVNAQYYDGYHDIDAIDGSAESPAALNLPGVRVSPQVYVDLSMAYRLHLSANLQPARDIDFRLNVDNLFDRLPPIATQTTLGYSLYGDPRGRRFQLSATAHF